MSGTLYVVATPIGNLDDLTPRARQTLGEVDLIAAEDTRRTGRLLSHIGCKKRLLALHDHNEAELANELVEMLKSGRSIAIVSDAGTPLVSDPGFKLVREAHQHGIAVSPVVGASAVTAALSASGLATDPFCFEGYLPSRPTARRSALYALAQEKRTLVFYESVHRIRDSLADMAAAFGASRLAFLARELTKLHEQCVQGTLQDLCAMVDAVEIVQKGEFAIVVAGAEAAAEAPLYADKLLLALVDRVSLKDAAQIAAAATGGKRNELYQRLLQLKGEAD